MNILECYENIKAKHHQLPELARAACQTSEQIIESTEALDAALKAFDFDQGWLCYQSSVVRLDKKETLDANTKEGGIALYGELVNTNSQQSLHIRQHLPGTWKLITLTEQSAQTEEQLSEDIKFIAMPTAEQQQLLTDTEQEPVIQGYLGYRRYSQRTDDQGYTPYAARFIGFTEEG